MEISLIILLCTYPNSIRSFFKKYWKQFQVFSSIFVIPFILAFWLFWYNVQVPVDGIKENNQSRYVINAEGLNEPNLRNTIRKIFSSPFNFSYYSVSIKNISQSVQVLTKEVIPGSVHVALRDKEGKKLKEFNMQGNETRWENFNSKNSELYLGELGGNFLFAPENFQHYNFTIDFELKAKPTIWEQFGLTLLFYFTYLAIFSAILTVHQFWKKYFNHQKWP